eukprot:TRINITY_DN2581_c1_g1_i4.p1 TRINITY_DN2581_c1_g1~~TRINITY_DN2581_c1_g1_i4.p1  ORF type:complete len:166 (+),score=25.14 TRINITY_DN2581_c1_g1_i4:58-498(+)
MGKFFQGLAVVTVVILGLLIASLFFFGWKTIFNEMFWFAIGFTVVVGGWNGSIGLVIAAEAVDDRKTKQLFSLVVPSMFAGLLVGSVVALVSAYFPSPTYLVINWGICMLFVLAYGAWIFSSIFDLRTGQRRMAPRASASFAHSVL